jgi:hypothetical protein
MPVNQIRRNGSYAPLSANYYLDDKMALAGERAELLYLRGLAFCASVLSDGYISEIQLVRFVAVGMNDAKKRAARLVEVGLWERADAGYWVVAWGKWNLTRDEIRKKQEADSARKAASRP